MLSIDYLATDLTPQEIERFERFLLEKAADEYSLYEERKRVFFNILKLLKHYNKLDEWYDAINKKECNHYSCFEYFSGLTTLSLANENPNMNELPIILARKFVYGKDTGGAFSGYGDGNTALYFLKILTVAQRMNLTKVIKNVKPLSNGFNLYKSNI